MVSSLRPLIQPPPVSGQMFVPRRARLASRAVGAGHRDVPGDAPQRVGRVARRRRRPVRVVILVPVFFVGLRDDASGLQLDLPLLEHQRVLAARPFLYRREAEPVGRAVLVLAMHWMTRGQMMVRVPLLDQRARRVRPCLVAEAVEIVAEVPRDVRERAQPRHRITDVPALVVAAGRGLGAVRRDVDDGRHDDVAVAGVPGHALPFLPVRDVEPRVVDAGPVEAVGILRDPRAQHHAEVVAGHHRLAPVDVGGPVDERADAVHLQAAQPIDDRLDDAVVAPSGDPEGRGAVEEIVLARAFPDEMPRVVLVHADWTTTMTVGRVERAGHALLECALMVGDLIRVVAGSGRHEADPEDAAVRRHRRSLPQPSAPLRPFCQTSRSA